MVCSLCRRSPFEQDVNKIVNFCSQYREDFSNAVILLVSLKKEKQYSTHYLPEKHKHKFIDICNFEITVLNTMSTAATKIVG